MAESMKAEQYISWISKDIKLDDDLKMYQEIFVVGSPSCGLSRKGRDLFEHYCYKTLDDYSELLDEMVGRIPDKGFYKSCKDLGLALTKHKWLGFSELPIDATEAVHIFVGEYSKDTLFERHFKDMPVVENKGTNEVRHDAAEQRRRITYVNKIFYHLRNSLAHGCFGSLELEKTKFYIFQDENRNHDISARMILRQSTLENWITILQKREAQALATAN